MEKKQKKKASETSKAKLAKFIEEDLRFMHDSKYAELHYKGLYLSDMYEYFKLLSDALYHEKRWKTKSKMCLALGLKKGQQRTESVLEHTGLHIPLLGAMMLAMEIENHTAHDLDPALLHLAFTVHDMAEALTGDICFMDKTKSDEGQESDKFDFLVSALPPASRSYLKKAYDIAEERCDAVRRKDVPLASISRNGRFFWAVEVVGYLMKALYETRHGKRVFANTFTDQAADILACQEFVSFRRLVNPMLEYMGEMVATHPYYKKVKKEGE
jgi:hypothetical protein